jgi:hypothetical protein
MIIREDDPSSPNSSSNNSSNDSLNDSLSNSQKNQKPVSFIPQEINSEVFDLLFDSERNNSND